MDAESDSFLRDKSSWWSKYPCVSTSHQHSIRVWMCYRKYHIGHWDGSQKHKVKDGFPVYSPISQARSPYQRVDVAMVCHLRQRKFTKVQSVRYISCYKRA